MVRITVWYYLDRDEELRTPSLSIYTLFGTWTSSIHSIQLYMAIDLYKPKAFEFLAIDLSGGQKEMGGLKLYLHPSICKTIFCFMFKQFHSRV